MSYNKKISPNEWLGSMDGNTITNAKIPIAGMVDLCKLKATSISTEEITVKTIVHEENYISKKTNTEKNVKPAILPGNSNAFSNSISADEKQKVKLQKEFRQIKEKYSH